MKQCKQTIALEKVSNDCLIYLASFLHRFINTVFEVDKSTRRGGFIQKQSVATKVSNKNPPTPRVNNRPLIQLMS